MATFQVRGPKWILTRWDEQSKERLFDRIFQTQIVVPNRRLESWGVYRRDPGWDGQNNPDDPGCVLFYSIWDTQADLIAKAWEADSRPAVHTRICYVTEFEALPLAADFRTLDHLLTRGTPIDKRGDRDAPEWVEFSIYRLLEWGDVSLTWDMHRQHVDCEKVVAELQQRIEDIIEEKVTNAPEIATMTLIYDWSPYAPVITSGELHEAGDSKGLG